MPCQFCQKTRQVVARMWQHMQPHRPHHLVICETCKRPIIFMHRSVEQPRGSGKRHHTSCLYQRRHVGPRRNNQ